MSERMICERTLVEGQIWSEWTLWVPVEPSPPAWWTPLCFKRRGSIKCDDSNLCGGVIDKRTDDGELLDSHEWALHDACANCPKLKKPVV